MTGPHSISKLEASGSLHCVLTVRFKPNSHTKPLSSTGPVGFAGRAGLYGLACGPCGPYGLYGPYGLLRACCGSTGWRARAWLRTLANLSADHGETIPGVVLNTPVADLLGYLGGMPGIFRLPKSAPCTLWLRPTLCVSNVVLILACSRGYSLEWFSVLYTCPFHCLIALT